MPEIAEVETVRNTLKKRILNKKIIDIKIFYEPMILSNIKDFKKDIIGKKFIDIKRVGKWLIFDLGDKYLLSHLRMEGKYFNKSNDEEITKHEHIIFYFEDNETLRYHDTRKFGRMKLIDKKDLFNTIEIAKQGYEPGQKELTAKYLIDKFKNKRLPIKTTLLDQTIISGLGNIYADEVLFESKINPIKVSSNITLKEAQNIVDASNKIITEAIKQGGTTIRSYTSSLGVKGNYQNNLKVHQKEGQPCTICNSKIIKIKVNGRGTYYCPKCQK